MLIVPWIVRHTSMSGLVLGQTFGVALVVFPHTKYYHSIAWRLEWTFLWAFRHSETQANLGSLSLSWSLSVSHSTPRRPICRIWIFPTGPTSLHMGNQQSVHSESTRNVGSPIEANHRIIKWYFHGSIRWCHLRYISTSIYSTPPSSQTLPSKFQESTNGIYIRSSGSLPSRCAGM